MDFKARCRVFEIDLEEYDEKLIKWRIRQLSSIAEEALIEIYISIWVETRAREKKKGNRLADFIGRHEANWYIRTLNRVNYEIGCRSQQYTAYTRKCRLR